MPVQDALIENNVAADPKDYRASTELALGYHAQTCGWHQGQLGRDQWLEQ